MHWFLACQSIPFVCVFLQCTMIGQTLLKVPNELIYQQLCKGTWTRVSWSCHVTWSGEILKKSRSKLSGGSTFWLVNNFWSSKQFGCQQIRWIKNIWGSTIVVVKHFWWAKKCWGQKCWILKNVGVKNLWGSNILGGQRFWRVKNFVGFKHFWGRKWGSTIFGGQHFWGQKCWGSTIFGGQHWGCLWLVMIGGRHIFRSQWGPPPWHTQYYPQNLNF